MRKTAKSILSLLLCVCLCVGMMVPAFAAELSFEASLSESELTTLAQEQTVTLTVSASELTTVDCLELNYIVPEGWTASIALSDDLAGFASTPNPATKYLEAYASAVAENVEDLVVITYTIPANVAEGAYNVGVENLLVASDANGVGELVDGGSATTTLKIVPVIGYSAGVNTTGSEVTIGDTVTVNVAVDHSSDDKYAAAEVVLSYDPTYLTLDKDSLSSVEYIDDNNGKLTILDYGNDKNFGTSCYAVAFTAAKTVEETIVTLTSAKFVNWEGASTSNLIPAAISPASVSIKINEVTYNVTLPEDGNIDGNSVAVKGQDYVFTADNAANYTYDVTVTVGGTEIDTVTVSNGTYTIPADSVTGDIVITYERTANSHVVQWEGTGAVDVTTKPTTATYGTDFVFTVPADVPAGGEPGADYEFAVTIGGTSYTGYNVEGQVVTIPGADITGIIAITVNKTVLDAHTYTVSVEGSAAGDAAIAGTPVAEGSAAKITVTKESGYNYTVTATMGGTAVTPSVSGNDYSVASVTGNVVFTVEKTLDVSSVEVYQYVQLNGTKMWLVVFDGSLTGKVPTYDGAAMYWSDKYDAYCYLVVADDLTADTAKTKLGAQTGTAVEVDYSMDINKTGVIDAADAQLVWNMYNAKYTGFGSLLISQFLAADQNAAIDKPADTWKITVEDAAAIISAILNGTAA